MIGLDTNVLARYIMQDDAQQSRLASELMASLTPDAPGFVPLVSVVELFWVLSSCYQLDRTQWVTALDAILRSKELVVENAEVVWQALRSFRDTAGDFADGLIERSASAAGCGQTMTFDKAATKHGGMTLLQ